MWLEYNVVLAFRIMTDFPTSCLMVHHWRGVQACNKLHPLCEWLSMYIISWHQAVKKPTHCPSSTREVAESSHCMFGCCLFIATAPPSSYCIWPIDSRSRSVKVQQLPPGTSAQIENPIGSVQPQGLTGSHFNSLAITWEGRGHSAAPLWS